MHYRRWWRKNNPKKNKIIQKRTSDKLNQLNGHWSDKQLICSVCDTTFTKVGPNQRYCSKRCQNAIINLRKQESYDPIKKHEYYVKNKTKINKGKTQYRYNKRNNDPLYRLKDNLRSRLNKAIQGDYRAGSAIRDLGCSIEKLKQHLESQFQSNMSWDNYGRKDGIRCWHVDHIKPLDSFDLSNPEDLRYACHYTNLQPLWADENLKKSSKNEV